MPKIAIAALACSAAAWGAEPVVDTDRVIVWDTTQVLPPAQHENAKVVVWDYTWRPHEPTHMHFHDKDAMAVFEATGAIQSTTPDGESTINEIKFGDIRFNGRDRAHTELLVRGSGRAVITELK